MRPGLGEGNERSLRALAQMSDEGQTQACPPLTTAARGRRAQDCSAGIPRTPGPLSVISIWTISASDGGPEGSACRKLRCVVDRVPEPWIARARAPADQPLSEDGEGQAPSDSAGS